jgi:hypothetical protein
VFDTGVSIRALKEGMYVWIESRWALGFRLWLKGSSPAPGQSNLNDDRGDYDDPAVPATNNIAHKYLKKYWSAQ